VQQEEEWMLFCRFDDPRAAEGLCVWLRNEQVKARAERGAVYVERSQCHRAYWVVDHLPPTEEDLMLLAGGV
jgi:hypothetical protein